MEDNRKVVHLDLDSFFVSVERLENSSLNGKPVIVGGLSDRGVVASCSYEARAFGVHSAMPSKLARQLCPQAVFVRGDMDRYAKFSGMVTDILQEKAPVVEKASIDEHYLDISGMDRFFGCLQWTRELRQRVIKETGLPISFGLSVNKTVSKVATGVAKPQGEKQVERGHEKQFLAPLPVGKIPMVGGKTLILLRGMGIDTVGNVQKMPAEMMQNVLGENGLSIWRKANGIDRTPVQPYTERKSISAENTFEEDTMDPQLLKQTLSGMVDRLGFQLRNENKVAGCITVKIRYSNFDTHTRQQSVPYTSADHKLLPVVLRLFDALYSRRMRIRLAGIKFSRLIHGCQQISLFDDTEEMISLYQAMDRMRRRFGAEAVTRAAALKSACL